MSWKRIIEAAYSQKNKDTIFTFVNVLYAEGLPDARILKYMSQLNIISRSFGKDFDQVTITDRYRFMAELEKLDKMDLNIYFQRNPFYIA
ncbi:MAG: hypothetical protein ACC612_10130 [Methanomethylovorans sp.]|uniref:hypothetical protein n=1 Tax=Methanomethylovorans sp. TaxID=2758717 RepID=UPI00353169CC